MPFELFMSVILTGTSEPTFPTGLRVLITILKRLANRLLPPHRKHCPGHKQPEPQHYPHSSLPYADCPAAALFVQGGVAAGFSH